MLDESEKRRFEEDKMHQDDMDELQEKYDRLYASVKYAHQQRGDDKCWMDFDKVFEAAGLPPQDKDVGDKFAMLKNCVRYVSCMTDGNWKTYEQLEQEIVELKKELDEVKQQRDSAQQDSNWRSL